MMKPNLLCVFYEALPPFLASVFAHHCLAFCATVTPNLSVSEHTVSVLALVRPRCCSWHLESASPGDKGWQTLTYPSSLSWSLAASRHPSLRTLGRVPWVLCANFPLPAPLLRRLSNATALHVRLPPIKTLDLLGNKPCWFMYLYHLAQLLRSRETAAYSPVPDGFRSWVHHIMIIGLWASKLTSLYSNFLTY